MKDGYWHDYYLAHKDEKKRSAREWYYSHPEQAKKSRKKWRTEHAEDARFRAKKWAEDHKERNRTKATEWNKTHREARRLISLKAAHKRRALEKDSGSFTSEEWIALCEKYDYRCLRCKDKRPLTVDHVIPISRGGTNTIDNIQPLCQSCNSIKHVKVLDYRGGKL